MLPSMSEGYVNRMKSLEDALRAEHTSGEDIARMQEDAYLALVSDQIQEKAYFLLLQRIQRLQNRQPAQRAGRF
jgi:hypothetical protein